MNAPEKVKQYDRDARVVGNIVHLEHFNVVVDDQRLATLFYVTGIGGTRDVRWVHTDGKERTLNYIIPSKNQCMSCHENRRVMEPIGPKARHLNKDFAYADGTVNQLTRWAKAGILSGAPDPAKAPRFPVWNEPKTGTLDQRARAYLAGQSEISRMTAGAVAGEIAEAWLQGRGLEELESPWEKYRKVTAEEVLQVARETFDPARRAEGVVRGSP